MSRATPPQDRAHAGDLPVLKPFNLNVETAGTFRLRPSHGVVIVVVFAATVLVGEAQAGRFIQAAHEDRYPLRVPRLPEEIRAAYAAEAAAGVVAGGIPGEPVLAFQAEVGAIDLRGGDVVP